jgi:hypothetical protein
MTFPFLPDNAVPCPNAYAVDVSPEQARQWLDGQTFQQPINPDTVRDLIERIHCGHWTSTHSAIAFDTNGVLLDGRHRLLAVIESGITLPMLVLTEQEPE